ncbi:MAG: hypothetical protein AVDCRST_MAG87-1552 [uncultured Thermomicrobiales bacterium]|uniref:HTH tetR-type domain-containing protein n=1 Tax=uncultured Thermomicrobiales bacterium TaxID=1645740 RepID=A0A6J4UX82_9BACT|nr:MAG: hypothetical protein AVDCRST_MAG87-1552 [uncultured Thermomicrobiales bacterium]
MAQPTTPNDPYQRRRAAGAASREETRRRLVVAADSLFREEGYPATTVVAIAKRAGVSLQTLYLAWGSKRSLLRAAAAATAVASETPVDSDEWRSIIRSELARDAGDDPTAGAYLAAASRLFVRVADRTGIYWRMYLQAAASDPEVASDWTEIERDRRHTMEDVARHVPARGLRPDLTPEDVADTLWALASPDVYHLFRTEGDRDSLAYQTWLERTLIGALCVT